jgi:outer membrane protein TolC
VIALVASALLAAAPGAPLTLDEALAEAARANPDLAVARADRGAADADRTTSIAGVLPRLDLAATFGHGFTGESGARTYIDPDTGEPRTIAESPATDSESYSLSLRLAQPLFDWGAFRDIGRAGWDLRAAERQLDETALAVAFEVTRRFFELVRADRTLAVLEKTAARSQDLVSRTDALYAAGRTPKSETFTARVNLGNDRIAVEQQRARAEQARTALAQVLGREASAELAVVPPASLDAAALPAEPPAGDALLAAARERRPALAAQRARVEAADDAVGGAKAGWFPTLSAQASYGRSGAVLAGDEGVWGNPERAYFASAELVLSWNLFEGRRTLAAVSRAESARDRARADADRTLEAVAKEVADARSLASSSARQIAIAAENLTTAEQGLALARERLDAGLATQLEVRDASLKLTQAELSLVEARIDHAVAFADLNRATGGAL